MSHWAELDGNNFVIRVIVGNNDDPAGDEGYSLISENLGGRWVKTSYNTYMGQHVRGGTPFRKNYAGIGYFYDEDLDAFIPPKNLDSWILDENTCMWIPPIEYPNDGKIYIWDEDSVSWKESDRQMVIPILPMLPE